MEPSGVADGALDAYRWMHALRGDLCARLGRAREAREALQRALALSESAAARAHLEQRLREVGPA